MGSRTRDLSGQFLFGNVNQMQYSSGTYCICNRSVVNYSRQDALQLRVRKMSWKVYFVLDAGSGSEGNDGTSTNEKSGASGLGGTRLGRIVQASANQLLNKLKGARNNFPMKTFLLLLGYYTANALATIIGQTGDWDVLVAAIAVAAIEGIGILKYRTLIGRRKLQSLITMLNFWKAGLCLGLFVDAFKLGS